MDKAVEFEKELSKPLTLSLTNNRLVLKNEGLWAMENSDIDKAATCIEDLVNKLECSQKEIIILKRELNDSNDTKVVTLQMLMEERQNNIHLEQEILEYKNELRESYRTIFELRDCIFQMTKKENSSRNS